VHLLLVEDDAMLAEAVCDAARQIAWTVDHVGDAAAAKLALVDHVYEAVLLDLGLPGDSGLAVLRTLRGRYDVTPVLILTARGQLSERILGWTRAPTTTSSNPSSSTNSGRGCAP
jgi:two-component system OmpR family response regulator